MTVVFCTRLFYPHIGGVEKHVLEIGKRLVQKGVRVIVITEDLPHDDNKKSTIEGIEIVRLNVGKENWFKKFRIWRETWRHKALFEQADVVHCHDVFFWYLPMRFVFFGKKVFTTFHGYESFPIRKKAVFARKLAEKLSAGNICIGDFIKKWYDTNPDLVSYGAVEVPQKKENVAYKNKYSAIFIGRLDEQTGINSYQKVFEILKRKYPEFNFVVFGDGPFGKQINNEIVLKGFVLEPEKYFGEFHFAFVSRYLSILEAMAARRMVFAFYDNPVKKDYLEMAPFAKYICIEKNPEKMVDKIEYFLNHPDEEQRKIEGGYRWASGQTWDKLTDQYLALWKKNIFEK